jgi:hypothetical protein
MIEEEDVMEICILKKHAKHFGQFAKKNNLPIFKATEEDDNSLIKAALNSPVLEKVAEGIISIVRDLPQRDDDYIDVDVEDEEDENKDKDEVKEEEKEEKEEFDLPPEVGEEDGKEEKE